MKAFATVALVLVLAGCKKPDNTRDPDAVSKRQARYTHKMCKCTEGGADPLACAEKVESKWGPWFAKVQANLDALKIPFDGDAFKTFTTDTESFRTCGRIAGLTDDELDAAKQ